MKDKEQEKKNLSKRKMWSTERQPKNRRQMNFMTHVRNSMLNDQDYFSLKNIEVLDEEGNPTGERVNGRVKMLKMDAFLLQYYNKLSRDPNLMRHFIDHWDGRPTQNIEVDKVETQSTTVELIIEPQEGKELPSEYKGKSKTKRVSKQSTSS